ncbi:Bud site selection protein 6 [Fusarium oxysporum f. sp. albedinis]|nr:Bud site selection protein 6 [Fusarium oxysporum f. sp. albedinis]
MDASASANEQTQFMHRRLREGNRKVNTDHRFHRLVWSCSAKPQNRASNNTINDSLSVVVTVPLPHNLPILQLSDPSFDPPRPSRPTLPL